MSDLKNKAPDNKTPDNKPQDNKPYVRPSERMFRRSRAAEARRRASERKDAKFIRLVYGIAGFAALLAFLLFYMFAQTVQAQETSEETPPETALTQPIYGDFTVLDLAGVAFVFIAGYAVWLQYKNRG